jgi:hypothetical protein
MAKVEILRGVYCIEIKPRLFYRRKNPSYDRMSDQISSATPGEEE